MTEPQILYLALALPGTNLHPHFERQAVRVGTRIFVTVGAGEPVTLKLSPLLQEAAVANHPGAVYAIGNSWGRQGWTRVEVDRLNPGVLEDLLDLAWRQVAPKKLIAEKDRA